MDSFYQIVQDPTGYLQAIAKVFSMDKESKLKVKINLMPPSGKMFDSDLCCGICTSLLFEP